MKLCFKDDCTNLRGIAQCPRCERPWCEEHRDEATNLCLWCVPVDEEEYQKAVQRALDSLRRSWED